MAIISSSVNVLIISSEDDHKQKKSPEKVAFLFVDCKQSVVNTRESVFGEELPTDVSMSVSVADKRRTS